MASVGSSGARTQERGCSSATASSEDDASAQIRRRQTGASILNQSLGRAARRELLDLDLAGLKLARTRLHNPAAERVVAGFSRLGEHGACWIGLGLAGAVRSPDDEVRHAWLRGVGVVAGAYALNFAIKVAVRRKRPQLPGLPPLSATVSQLSFPSAHATTSFAAARAYSGLAPSGALYAVAAAFGLSRPYLGVHYPSDVVAGALLGTALGGLAR